MKRRKGKTRIKLSKPRHYLKEIIRRAPKRNDARDAVIHGNYLDLLYGRRVGWLRFVPAGESAEVCLKIPPGGHALAGC